MTAAMPQAAKDAMMPTIPMQRLGAPEDVAKAVAFLASDEAAYVTGQVLASTGHGDVKHPRGTVSPLDAPPVCHRLR